MYISRLDYLLTGLMMFCAGFLSCDLWASWKQIGDDELEDESQDGENKQDR